MNDASVVVIGSSPLMLMQAQRLARAGHHVTIVDRSSRLGGCWQVAELRPGQMVETACHLIEPFPGVYEALSADSGLEFAPLDLQPVRVDVTGRAAEYVSRRMIALSAARMSATMSAEAVRRLTGRTNDGTRMESARWKLGSLVRHQRRHLVVQPIVHGPTDGHAALVDALLERCRSAGVGFRQAGVVAASSDRGRWRIETTDSSPMMCDRVVATSSAGLIPSGLGRLESAAHRSADRRAVVVDLLAAHVELPHSYVAYWRDPVFSRASRVDPAPTSDTVRYLLELRGDRRAHRDEIAATLKRSGLLGSRGTLVGVDEVSYRIAAGARQMPSGEIAPGFTSLRSSGNLAAGIARWLPTPLAQGDLVSR